MSFDDLPRPETRQTVVVLNNADFRSTRRDPEFADQFVDPTVTFVSFNSEGPLVHLLRAQNQFRPGVILIQSPFSSSRYVEPGRALTDFTIEKFNVLSKLVQTLGGRQLSVDSINTADVSSETATSVKGSATGKADIAATVEVQLQRALQNSIQRVVTYAGGEPDVAGAHDLLARLRLAGDPSFTGLVDLRTGPNPACSVSMTVSSAEEANRSVHIAADISTGLKKLKLASVKSDVSTTTARRLTAAVHTKIEF